MSLSELQKKYFDKNPRAVAYFMHNERLGKNVCYVYDTTSKQTNGIIDEKLKKAFCESVSEDETDIFKRFLEFIGNKKLGNDKIEKITDCYYDYILSGSHYQTADEVIDAINDYSSKTNPSSKSNSSRISAYFALENGELEPSSIFTMDVSFKKNKRGESLCKIENTFTDEEYKGCGIHSNGIRFLEAVLAKKNVYTLVGEALECGEFVSDSDSNLNEHYMKLGFSLVYNNLGESRIIKQIDPNFELPITKRDFDLEK